MKKTANIWEYKVGINAIIANLVCMLKSRIHENKIILDLSLCIVITFNHESQREPVFHILVRKLESSISL